VTDYSRTAERLVLYLMLLVGAAVWLFIGGTVFFGILRAVG